MVETIHTLVCNIVYIMHKSQHNENVVFNRTVYTFCAAYFLCLTHTHTCMMAYYKPGFSLPSLMHYV